nr:MAG TPA: intron associated endonuclease [Caudoviricetes sp.]
MEWYIILFIVAAAVAGLIIGYLIKRHKDLVIDTSLLNEYDLQIKEKEEKLNNITEKTNNLKKEFDNVKKATDSAIDSFNKLTESMKEAQERELKICYENGLDEVKQKLQKADELLLLNHNQNKLKYDKEIQEIQKELESFKAARQSIIEEQKRQEEMETNRSFYMLQIGEFDKEDIKQLRTIEPMLHNKEVLNKLIWSTYYQTPYKDLIGRIFGTNKVSGIYKITCINNGKIYIGKSVDVANRWAEHIKSSLEIGTIAKNQLYTLMKEKGAENFTFELLEEVNKDKLLERESYWIKFYETDSYGLNMKG